MMEVALQNLCHATSCLKTSPTMPSADVEDLRKHLTTYNQDHLLQFWPQLTPEQKQHLLSDIQSVDFADLAKAYKSVLAERDESSKLDELLEPIPEELHGGVSRCTAKQLQEYKNTGLRQISEGRVAALLLAGGQGTRLGVAYPKGMYNVGLPSGKTLYQLQGERLLKLQELAYKLTGKRGDIPWYIMTSEHTMEPTLEFFAKHDYFGLQKDNLVVFEQYMLPCLTMEGKVILENRWKLAKAPDGNGGLYRALHMRGILQDMAKRGIQYIHVYCVDNILVKMADPVFIGYCISKNANCAAKVVEKTVPTEAVGVVCRVGGKFQVVEYSEISAATSQRRNADGRLTFSAGNICNHFFTLDFLKQIGNGDKRLKYHVATKKIPYVNEDGDVIKPLKPNGIKLEKFVFDVFEFSDKFAAWEVDRNEEFSPLKNSDNCPKDTPTTARHALFSLHQKYVRRAGGAFQEESNCNGSGELNGTANGHGNHKEMNGTANGHGEPDFVVEKNGLHQVCEISPLVSYAGEGLEELVAGKVFSGPLILNTPRERMASEKADK